MTVADILKAEPKSIDVFKKYGLDYFGCSDHPFDEACRKCSVDPRIVKEELLRLRLSLKGLHKSFGQLLEDVLHHHSAIKKAIPLLRESFLVALEHQGGCRNELLPLKTRFNTLIERLKIHLYKEEIILFPEFINLWNKTLYRTGYQLPFRMMHPIKGLESDHESALTILIDIRELVRHYNRPKKGDKPYGEIFRQLEFFGKNLIKLIDLENQILFPEALALEKIFEND